MPHTVWVPRPCLLLAGVGLCKGRWGHGWSSASPTEGSASVFVLVACSEPVQHCTMCATPVVSHTLLLSGVVGLSLVSLQLCAFLAYPFSGSQPCTCLFLITVHSRHHHCGVRSPSPALSLLLPSLRLPAPTPLPPSPGWLPSPSPLTLPLRPHFGGVARGLKDEGGKGELRWLSPASWWVGRLGRGISGFVGGAGGVSV